MSAPLLLDPTSREMTGKMKKLCRKFEEVTLWRIPVMERVGNRIRSISKAKPLKEKGCKRTGCFRALLVGETVRGMAQVTG